MGTWEENKEARVAAPQGEENTVVNKVCNEEVGSLRALKVTVYFWQKENTACSSYAPLPS